MRNSYPVGVTLRGERLWLVWQSEDVADAAALPDGVAVEQGRIVHARTGEGLEELAARFGFERDEESLIVDFDAVEDVPAGPLRDDACSRLVETWNLLGDVASSVGADLADRGPVAERCYDKLFAGMNLEPLTPAGEHFTPVISGEERDALTAVLRRGIAILEARL